MQFRKLLANLWARQAVLQCSFNQASIHCLIPIYMGSMANDAIFDPAMLTGIVVQVQYKSKGDLASGQNIRPFGIFRDLEAPLPYVAFLMELGTESAYGHQGKKVESTVWSRDRNTKFSTLVQEWSVEVDNLAKA